MSIAIDRNLITALFDTMEKTGADFTNTFRCLSRVTPTNCSSPERFEVQLFYFNIICYSFSLYNQSDLQGELKKGGGGGGGLWKA